MHTRRLGVALICLCAALLAAVQCSASISVSGSLAHVYKTGPGEALQGSIEIVNTGEAVAEARLYLTDYLYYADGTNIYGEAGKDARSNASWIVLRTERVSVPPKGRVSVPYYINVPAAQLRGSYWSMVMVEENAPPQEVAGVGNGAAEKDKVTMGVVARVRYGIQVITEIGDGVKNISVAAAALTRNAAGVNVLYLDVENPGEARIRPQMIVYVYDGSGSYVGKFEGTKMGLLPGTSGRFTAALDGLSAGNYAVLVVLEGEDAAWGVQYDLQIQ